MKACTQCGRCCIAYSDGGLSASAEDIEGWEAFNPAIMEFVQNGEIWIDPASGKRLTRCPWLIEQTLSDGSSAVIYSCQIYHDRPEDCRQYPTSIAEMARDDCKMLEFQDLGDPKRAQRELDIIMADSRPPYSS